MLLVKRSDIRTAITLYKFGAFNIKALPLNLFPLNIFQ